MLIIGLLEKKADPNVNGVKNGEKNIGRKLNRGEGISGVKGELRKKKLCRGEKLKNGDRTKTRNAKGLNAKKKVDCGNVKNGEKKKWL
ncbi:MAG: hypothetical protein ACRENF_07185 [Thermodesulfobacteriota bacterium]